MNKEEFKIKAKKVLLKHLPIIMPSNTYILNHQEFNWFLMDVGNEVVSIESDLAPVEKREIADWVCGKIDEAYKSFTS